MAFALYDATVPVFSQILGRIPAEAQATILAHGGVPNSRAPVCPFTTQRSVM